MAHAFLEEIDPDGLVVQHPVGEPGEARLRHMIERVEHLVTIYTTPGFTDERIHLFMAVGLTHGEVAREADEFIEVETMTLSRALSLVERGEIQDAKTALALLYSAGFRAGR